GGGGLGMGRGQGRGAGQGRGLGPQGDCVCSKCGKSMPHQRGVPCTDMKCPECGALVVRQG
ncbi:MAG: hypothetical protein RAP03_13295, partial [Candidatus Electryonea clarkiae]|nr:hypothetical protein [Candidatus Electryonea clarkiae]